MEGKQLSEGHSLPRDGIGQDLSGHRKKLTNRGALTLWQWQREGLVRPQKESTRARGTHRLEMAEGGTCQNMERKYPSKGHPPTGDHIRRDLLGHGKEATK